MCVFGGSTFEAIDYIRKAVAGQSKDERTRDQDGMEKPAAQDESGAGIKRQWR